jgi:PAS domain S-box-containing protein
MMTIATIQGKRVPTSFPDANAAASNGSRRMLVIDDDPATRATFAGIFSETGTSGESAFEVDYASHGEEGWNLVQDAFNTGRPYTVAFIDAMMGEAANGLETTLRIWELDPYVQVVLFSGKHRYSFEEVVAKLGHSDRFVILEKPFAAVEVQQLASAFVEKWTVLRRFRESNHSLRESEQMHLFVADELETCVVERTTELESTRRRLEHLLRSSPSVIYSQKATNPPRFTFVSDNVTALWGHAPSDLMFQEKFWIEHLHPEDAAIVPLERARIFKTGHHAIEYRFRHENGAYVWVHDDARLISDADGKPVEIIGSLRDISARKGVELEQQKMEVQLRQAQKLEAIGQLAAGIAHEINTPTQYVGDNTRFFKDSFENIRNVLKSHEEVLRAARNNSLSPETLEQAEKILRDSDLEYLFEQVPAAINETLEGVERVTKIVRAMKEFSHPGGKEKSPADLNKAIESTVTVARNEWKYVAEVTLELDPNLPLVPCFLGEFNQVILNLVINASHAIADVVKQSPGTSGNITVATRRDGDCVEVRVADTGTGIPENVRARIFEPFFTTKPVGKGTGQGLSIVYTNIVKKHGGTVTFESQTGKGTTFILRLPLTPQK